MRRPRTMQETYIAQDETKTLKREVSGFSGVQTASARSVYSAGRNEKEKTLTLRGFQVSWRTASICESVFELRRGEFAKTDAKRRASGKPETQHVQSFFFCGFGQAPSSEKFGLIRSRELLKQQYD